MSNEPERRVGHVEIATRIAELATHQEHLTNDVTDLKKDMKEILAAANKAKGGWLTLIAVGGVAGSVGAMVGKFLPFFIAKP